LDGIAFLVTVSDCPDSIAMAGTKCPPMHPLKISLTATDKNRAQNHRILPLRTRSFGVAGDARASTNETDSPDC
jgi:hypothetical protein